MWPNFFPFGICVLLLASTVLKNNIPFPNDFACSSQLHTDYKPAWTVSFTINTAVAQRVWKSWPVRAGRDLKKSSIPTLSAYREGHRGSRRVSDLPEVTRLVSGRVIGAMGQIRGTVLETWNELRLLRVPRKVGRSIFKMEMPGAMLGGRERTWALWGRNPASLRR